jgi:hypothetical protein
MFLNSSSASLGAVLLETGACGVRAPVAAIANVKLRQNPPKTLQIFARFILMDSCLAMEVKEVYAEWFRELPESLLYA